MEQVNLNKIHEDLEFLKRDIYEIKVAINIEPELKESIKKQIKEARIRIDNSEFVSNEEMLKKFS